MASKSPSVTWSEAEVGEDGRLSVRVKAPTGIDAEIWAEAVDFVAGVRSREAAGGDWGEISFDPESETIEVADVGDGSEDQLREALDGLVSSAHTVATRAQEAADKAGDEEPDADSATRAKEMQKRFRKA